MLHANYAQEQLNEKIRRFATTAMESRQVASRLRDLLPVRFNDIKRHHYMHRKSVGKAERFALTDQHFVAHVNELVEMSFDALQARVLYETHVMLVQARQSLNAARR